MNDVQEINHIETKIAVLFSENTVSELFSQLLGAHGANVHKLFDVSEVSPQYKLVTEPKLYKQINKESLPKDNQCLIIAAKNVNVESKAKVLNQPLTEEKLEVAINFLFEKK